MTRQEFDQHFKPMAKGLQVQVNPNQATYFWEQYQKVFVADFAAGCQYAARCTPGYLPKPIALDDYINAAREMRLQGEAQKRNTQAQAFFNRQYAHTEDPMERLFGECCLQNLLSITTKGQEGNLQVVRDALAQPDFILWANSYKTKDGMTQRLWLEKELIARGGRQ